jgi:D-tyrosyl-tRNA(Tyr) deacylase
MRLVIQRVNKAKVEVAGQVAGEIGRGLLVLVGIGRQDSGSEIDWLVTKLLGLRIFEDEAGKMNLNVLDVKGEVLLVSQFTLYADCRKGRRPGFDQAALPDKAELLFNRFVEKVRGEGLAAPTGVFGAHMQVSLVNDGPVTIQLER